MSICPNTSLDGSFARLKSYGDIRCPYEGLEWFVVWRFASDIDISSLFLRSKNHKVSGMFYVCCIDPSPAADA